MAQKHILAHDRPKYQILIQNDWREPEGMMGHALGDAKAACINKRTDDLREIYAGFERLLAVEKTSRDEGTVLAADVDGKLQGYKDEVRGLRSAPADPVGRSTSNGPTGSGASQAKRKLAGSEIRNKTAQFCLYCRVKLAI